MTGTNLVDTFVAAAGGTRTITLQQADILQAGEPLHTWTIIVRPRNNKPPYPGSTGTPPVGTEADGSITVTSMAINYKKRNL